MPQRARWSLYGLLIALRLLFSLLPGYIQPDEYFQSPEITAASAFDLEIFTPWEFEPAFSARSIVPPLLTTGIPFLAYKFVYQLLHPEWDQAMVNGKRLFLVQRLSFFCLSFLLDYCIVKLCRLCKTNALRSLLLLSSSYVMLAYQCHSFSNSIEAVVLALSITLLFLSHPPDSQQQAPPLASFCLGISLAFGLFTRITFVLFGAPVGCAYLYMAWKRASGARSRIQAFASNLLPFVFGLTLSIASFTVIDSIYFGTLTVALRDSDEDAFNILSTLFPALWPNLHIQGTLTSTMMNNLLYNVDKDNLQLHGLHPYYLHAIVNVPLLFGPIGLWLYWKFANCVGKRIAATSNPIDMVLVSSMVTGLLGLSAFPHQEARFLTPMLLPSVFLFARHTAKVPRTFWVVWIIFNGILAVIFGWVHQGGVVPAVIYTGNQSKQIHGCDIVSGQYALCHTSSSSEVTDTPVNGPTFITNVIFYKTYMPPRHLLAYPKKWRDSSDVIINVTDLAGTSIEKARAVIQSQTHVPAELVPEDDSKVLFSYNADINAYERTLLIMPGTANRPIDKNRMRQIARFRPHVNFDDLDKLIQDLSLESISLNIYLIVNPVNPIEH